MTPYEWLHEVVEAANRVVSRTWVGHYDLPAASGDGTARDVLDRIFRSVTRSTVALGGDGEEAGHPFTYDWVPMSELEAATRRLLAAASRSADGGPSEDLDGRLCAAATELLLLTIDLADTIGITYGPTQEQRDAVSALPRT